MLEKKTGEISAEGWAVDGAINALTLGVLKGKVAKEEADRVANQLLESPIGKVAAQENREAVDKWIADHS